jgi:alkylation response protein AidB-like acyl-CoA dehydrogenase
MTSLTFDDAAADFGAAVARFAEQFGDANEPPDRTAWKQAGELGLTGLEIDESFGGHRSGDYRITAAAVHALARISHGTSSTFTISFDIATPYLARYASAEVQQRWLPRLAAGEAIAALALTEPGAGSDLAAMTTRADPMDGGWSITGAKTFITNGSIADVIVVAARTSAQDRGRGISLFAVDASAPGLSRRPLATIGQHDCDTGELFFDECQVPTSALVGTLDEGLGVLLQRLPQERVTSSIANLTQTDVAFDLIVRQVNERRAFGRSIGSLQHNAFRLAELDARRSAVAAFLSTCIDKVSDGTLTTADAARAKLLTARLENDVYDLGMQLHGGSSFLEGTEINRRWIDARVTRIWAGADEVMLHLISKDIGLSS